MSGRVWLVTGNDLKRGDVLWWTGKGWSRDCDRAQPLDRGTGEAVLAGQAAGERVCDLALVEAETANASVRPVRIRERIRAFGPTVRPDLAIEGRDWR